MSKVKKRKLCCKVIDSGMMEEIEKNIMNFFESEAGNDIELVSMFSINKNTIAVVFYKYL